MKIKLLIILVMSSQHLFAWTLNSSTGKGFNNNEIDIFIANDDCSAIGFTADKYRSLVQNAMDDYWNDVPTSSVFLDVQGVRSDISLDGDTHSAALAKVPINSILAGCNNDAKDFNNTGILGSAVMTCTGSDCRAVLILNTNSVLSTKSQSDIEGVIAHEVGHAFGLGHSEYKHNLMYFSISGKNQKWLGMDDINGVSYLYPHESDLDILGISAIGNCGSINLDPPDNKPNKFLWSFLVGLIFIILLTLTQNFSVTRYFRKRH